MAELIRRGAARRLGLRREHYRLPLAAVDLPDGRTLHAVLVGGPALRWRRNGRPRWSPTKGAHCLLDGEGRVVHSPGVAITAGMVRAEREVTHDL